MTTLDPGGSGRALSLCVVSSRGNVWAWAPWLQDQLMPLWEDREAVMRVSEAHVAILRKYGANMLPSGKQYNMPLASLAGREKEFVAELAGLVEMIERIAAQKS